MTAPTQPGRRSRAPKEAAIAARLVQRDSRAGRREGLGDGAPGQQCPGQRGSLRWDLLLQLRGWRGQRVRHCALPPGAPLREPAAQAPRARNPAATASAASALALPRGMARRGAAPGPEPGSAGHAGGSGCQPEVRGWGRGRALGNAVPHGGSHFSWAAGSRVSSLGISAAPGPATAHHDVV